MTDKEKQEAWKFLNENKERFEKVWGELVVTHPKLALKIIKTYLPELLSK